MFGKILALFICIIYFYLLFKGIEKYMEDKCCKKYYLNNRKNCKCYTCRFYGYCKGKKEVINDDVENENKILKAKSGEYNDVDI